MEVDDLNYQESSTTEQQMTNQNPNKNDALFSDNSENKSLNPKQSAGQKKVQLQS